jgi:RNA-directed DNA polymerase
MSGQSEKNVPATGLVVLDPGQAAKPSAELREQRKAERAARALERDKALQRWKAIEQAGGVPAWINAELRSQGLLVDEDGSTVAEGAKSSFKERKKAEAEARRSLVKLARKAYLATHIDFLGQGVFYRDDDDETSREKEARLLRARANDLSLESFTELAKALAVDVPTLRKLCFHRDVESSSNYEFWTIAKRDGTRRTISAPKPELKRIQRWLLKNLVDKLPVHGAAHGFLRARSIASNAKAHAGAELVVKIDVKDFFPTVTFRRVKGLFRSGGLPESVATLCALLATEPPRELVQFRGKTLYVAQGARSCPQGAPTSPAITNALCMRLDRRISGLARLLEFSYTRYADDLTFSWNTPSVGPSGEPLPPHSRAAAPVGTLLRGVAQILEAEGFRMHRKKTAVRRAGSSQRVTGLVVNKAVSPEVPPARVPRETVRRLRAAIHNREQGKPGKDGESLEQLQGMAAFIFMVDPKKGRVFLERIKALEARASG